MVRDHLAQDAAETVLPIRRAAPGSPGAVPDRSRAARPKQRPAGRRSGDRQNDLFVGAALFVDQ
jgi:hypothetical protein